MKHLPELIDTGWEYFDSCRCGLFRVEYRHNDHPDLTLYLFPGQGLFTVKYRGSSTKIPVSRVDKLAEILKTL